MWIVMNKSFVSIVQHHSRPDSLVVRGRFPGDVARFLGVSEAMELETPENDYRYRVVVSRRRVAEALVRASESVDYPNFKDSITDGFRSVPAIQTWSAWYNAQHDYHRGDISAEGCYGGTDD